MTTSDTIYRKEIKYQFGTQDFDAYLDGEYIGSFPNYHDAEVELNRLALELIGFVAGWDMAAEVHNGIAE